MAGYYDCLTDTEHDEIILLIREGNNRRIRRQSEEALAHLGTAPWHDPHFVNILRRCYRHWRESEERKLR